MIIISLAQHRQCFFFFELFVRWRSHKLISSNRTRGCVQEHYNASLWNDAAIVCNDADVTTRLLLALSMLFHVQLWSGLTSDPFLMRTQRSRSRDDFPNAICFKKQKPKRCVWASRGYLCTTATFIFTSTRKSGFSLESACWWSGQVIVGLVHACACCLNLCVVWICVLFEFVCCLNEWLNTYFFVECWIWTLFYLGMISQLKSSFFCNFIFSHQKHKTQNI